MLSCKFCGREAKNKNSNVCHERLCKHNPDKQVSNIERSGGMTGKEPWNKGKVLGERPKDIVDKIAKLGIGRKHTTESKEKMSASRKTLYASGWEPTCGRAKKYVYNSPIAGQVSLDGTWELKVAKYLDSINVIWHRNKTRFPYINLKSEESTYQPDFYIETWGTYLEVKGYETELDRCKWSQFTEPLLIWRKREIDELTNWVVG